MSRVIPYVMRPERQREVRYARRGHRRPQGPPLGRQSGLYVAARRPRSGSPVCTRRSHILPPQPPAQTQYVRPRAPCTSAPPHADGEEWGGGRVFPSSRGSLSRQFGGVPGKADCVSQSGRTTYPAGCPSPPRARAALVRTGWPETAVGPPAAPRSSAHLHAGNRGGGGGGALLGARRQPAGGPTGMPVASRSVDGRSFPAVLRAVHPPDAASAGRGGRGRRGAIPRGRPARAPRRHHTARRGRPAFHFAKAPLDARAGASRALCVRGCIDLLKGRRVSRE